MTRRVHQMQFGAELRKQGVRFRLWAPGASRVDLCLEGATPRLIPMQADDGWYETIEPEARAGSRYRFRIDGGIQVPDPASRFQPDDVHNASEVIDPGAFQWEDGGWIGRPWEEAVVYELHVGAYTGAGTFTALIERLDHLAELGVTAVELMPVADFPGRHNWGYDGVLPFAPDHRYGRPEELKALVQAAHARGLMVLLDVVYNHFGPEGNYLHTYAPQFFTDRHHTPWGAAINFDGQHSRPVRDFFISNALYWLEEYHFDGLRLDAVHAIIDDSQPDILEELAAAVHTRFPQRHVHLVLENDANQARYLRRDEAGRPRQYTAQWNDDVHHTLHVLLTGESSGYYRDYAEDPLAHLGRCLTEGFAYQGQPSVFRNGRLRGEVSSDLPSTAFVAFLQNHDQVGNRAFGERISVLAPVEAVEAVTALLLLSPSPPLLFMGDEWGAIQPFQFFCDFGPDLAPKVAEGRRGEFADFPAFRDPELRAQIPDPGDPRTFESSRLDWGQRDSPEGRRRLALYQRLLGLRRRELASRLTGLRGGAARWERLGSRALLADWPLADGSHWMLLVNLSETPLSTPRPVAQACAGARLIHATHEPGLEMDKLPAWYLACLVAE